MRLVDEQSVERRAPRPLPKLNLPDPVDELIIKATGDRDSESSGARPVCLWSLHLGSLRLPGVGCHPPPNEPPRVDQCTPTSQLRAVWVTALSGSQTAPAAEPTEPTCKEG